MRSLIAALLFATACSSAYADRAPMNPQIAIDVAPAKIRAPYDVQIIRENGDTLPTYAAHDRFYVQGTAGERYTIRITNPTSHRVEAVVSVDGLDAIDGEPGDLHKRGYIVPPWGEVRVEGFRTSLADVATFRFSSVDGSYAGQKGKARNVGVIAVALFEEEHAPEQQIVTPAPERYYDWTDDLDAEASRPATKGTGSVARADGAKDKKADYAPGKRPARPADVRAERVAPAPTTTAAPSGGAASRPAPPPHRVSADEDVAGGDFGGEGGYYQPAPEPTPAPTTQRPGLGTEFGESRYSAASYTRFVRATLRPIAVAELRYNDAAGLMALGIPVQPMPDSGEIMLRETADPFPGDHFARPAR